MPLDDHSAGLQLADAVSGAVPSATWFVAGLLLGALAGWLLWAVLRHRRYRQPSERTLPRRQLWWLVPVTMLASAAVLARHAPQRPLLVAVPVLATTWMLAGLSAVDLDVHRLPDRVTLPAYPVGLVVLAAASWASEDWAAYRRSLVAMVAVAAAFLMLSLVGSGVPAFGLGDVKLAGVLGLVLGWFGWGAVLLGIYLAVLLGGLTALVLLVCRRAGRGSAIAFGPFLALGAVLALSVS